MSWDAKDADEKFKDLSARGIKDLSLLIFKDINFEKIF
jgi:hypothetical protein